MVVSLVEMYHTRYFYLTYVKDLTYLFNSCQTLKSNPELALHAGSELMSKVFDCIRRNEPVIFDLANAKLSTDVRNVIQRFMVEGLQFTDSQDAIRQRVLETNVERINTDVTETHDLPPIMYNQPLKEYLSALDNTIVYSTTQFSDNSMLMPLLAIILIRRPTVKVHVTSQLSQFMSFIADLIPNEYTLQHADFLYTTIEGTLPVKAVDGKIPTQNHGYVPIVDAMTYGCLVPSELGTKNLSKEPMWHDVLDTCINMLNKCKKRSSVYLSDIL